LQAESVNKLFKIKALAAAFQPCYQAGLWLTWRANNGTQAAHVPDQVSLTYWNNLFFSL
jgi:hypothetical protein